MRCHRFRPDSFSDALTSLRSQAILGSMILPLSYAIYPILSKRGSTTNLYYFYYYSDLIFKPHFIICDATIGAFVCDFTAEPGSFNYFEEFALGSRMSNNKIHDL